MKTLSTVLAGVVVGGLISWAGGAAAQNLVAGREGIDYVRAQQNLAAKAAAQTLLTARVGQPSAVTTLVASPISHPTLFCGLAAMQDGGFVAFKADGKGAPAEITQVEAVEPRRNALLIAHSQAVSDCGASAPAHTIIEYGEAAPFIRY